MKNSKGYTLVELMVAIGLFAAVMLLASGAYLVVIGLNRQAQAASTGINNLSFALESMVRNIRTGSGYHCGSQSGGDCSGGITPNGADSFYFTNAQGKAFCYKLSGSTIVQPSGGTGNCTGSTVALTDPTITVSSLTFYLYGSTPRDGVQPRVTILVSGTVSTGPGGKHRDFTIETGATMRGSDI